MHKNEEGLSLIEIILASTILIGIALGLSKMSVHTNKQVKTSEKNLEIVSLLSEIRGLLSKPAACKQSFDGLDASNTTGITHIQNEDGVAVFEIDKQYGSTNLRIKSMSLSDALDEVTVNDNAQNGTTNFLIEFDRGAKATSTRFITKKLRLNINTQAGVGNKNIDTCHSFSAGETSLWSRNNTDPTKIFYNNGNVGIGESDPIEALEVNGRTKTNSLILTDNILFAENNSQPIILRNSDYSPASLHTHNIKVNKKIDMANIYGKDVGITIRATSPYRIANFTNLSNPSTGAVTAYAYPTPGTNQAAIYAHAGNSGLGLTAYSKLGTGARLMGKTIGTEAYGDQFDFYANGPGVDYGTASSIRWKKNLQFLKNPLKTVLSLQAYSFDYKQEYGGHHAIGFIAEEVGELIPEVVSFEKDSSYAIGLDYSKLTPFLVEAIKEQQKMISHFEQKNKSLQQKLKLLQSFICSREDFKNSHYCLENND